VVSWVNDSVFFTHPPPWCGCFWSEYFLVQYNVDSILIDFVGYLRITAYLFVYSFRYKHYLGKACDGNVGQSTWNIPTIPTTTGRLAGHSLRAVCTQRRNLSQDPVTFQLAPLWRQHLWFSVKCPTMDYNKKKDIWGITLYTLHFSSVSSIQSFFLVICCFIVYYIILD